jgi:hypothetical protein
MKTLMTTLAVLSVAVTVMPLDTISRRLVDLRVRSRSAIRSARRWLGHQVQQMGRWIQGECPVQAPGEAARTQADYFGSLRAAPQNGATRVPEPIGAPVAVARPSRPVRLHIDPVDHRHAVIAGSMADVCAMLDRLAAADEPVRGVPAL